MSRSTLVLLMIAIPAQTAWAQKSGDDATPVAEADPRPWGPDDR